MVAGTGEVNGNFLLNKLFECINQRTIEIGRCTYGREISHLHIRVASSASLRVHVSSGSLFEWTGTASALTSALARHGRRVMKRMDCSATIDVPFTGKGQTHTHTGPKKWLGSVTRGVVAKDGIFAVLAEQKSERSMN